MSEQVTVKSVGEGNPWQHGITYYDVLFERNGADFEASWGKKGDPPLPGESVTGEFSQKNGDWKFKKASADFSGGSTNSSPASSGGSKAGKEWKPESQFDPEKTARIGRAHAQHMSILALHAMGTFQSVSADQIGAKLKQWTDFFEQDVNEAGQAASQAQGGSPAPQAGASPPVSASPGSDSRSAGDEHQWFCKLLELANLSPGSANTLATYIVEKFDGDQKARAERGLEDIGSQGETLARLKAAYEKSEGRPLPSDDPDDNLPC